MAQTVEQSLQVTPQASATVTITLDGDTAALLAGGGGVAGQLMLRTAAGATAAELGADGTLTLGSVAGSGQLKLRDTAGQVRLELFGQGSQMLMRNAQGVEIGRLGLNADLQLGGGNSDGDLRLRDGKGILRIELDAGGQRLRLRNAQGQIVGSLGGGLLVADANLDLGGNGSDGDVKLRDAQGKSRIELEATTQRLRFLDAAGNVVGLLGVNGNLTLGGHGIDGDVDLYDNAGQRRILLDAQGQSLSFYNSAGKVVGQISASSNLYLGGHGGDGDILLFPAAATGFDAGQASIHLDGEAGDILLRNADCAEEFQVRALAEAEPGTVMALGDDGALQPSGGAYERAVVGVVSGAGPLRPGIVLDRQPERSDRRPIALVGKAWVKVCDEGGPIARGDLLVSSATTGRAMRAADPARAFGAVIGKAMAPHAGGTGLIPMLIALQ